MALDPDTRARLFPPGQRVVIWMPTKHMGNLLVALKSIEVLVQAMPQCRWYLVVNRAYADVVAAAGLPVTPILYTGSAGTDLAGQIRTAALIPQLRRLRPFVSIALEGDKTSLRLIPLCGSKTTIGPGKGYGRPFSIPVPVDANTGHRFDHYAAVAAFITGTVPTPDYPLLAASPHALAWIARLLALKLPQPQQPFAILHAGATKTYKQWPLAHFAALADDLQRRGVNVVLTGAGASDGDAIERVIGLCHQPVLSLHNQLNLDTLIALCQRALFFVGNDTGPTHLAAATGAPTYALFGPTDDSRWGPVGGSATILRSPQPCEPLCSRSFCLANYRCMQTLTPELVRAAIPGYPRPARTEPVVTDSTPHSGRQPVVLHVFKRYNGNYPLLNAMVDTTPGKYRTLVCYLSGDDDGNNRLDEHGARAIHLNLPKRSLNWHNRKTLKALRQVIDREDVDLVICQFRRTVPIGAIAARLSRQRPKVVAVLHGIVGGHNSLSLQLLNWLINPLVALWVSVSKDSMEEDILGQNIAISREKVTYVQNGIDYQPYIDCATKADVHGLFPGSSGRERIFIAVGRLAPVKNHQRILHAFRELLDSGDDVLLLIVGAGPDKQHLEQLISKLGLTGKVILAGFRSDVPALLKAADVFLLPSLREGLALSLLEALGSGIPVITSNRKGMKEVIEDVPCGWLVDPEDTDALATAMQQAAALPATELHTMGERGRAHVLEHFNTRRMSLNYERLYDRLLGRPLARDALVSVIMPAYNSADFIRDSLLSACLQSYDNLEILVVDDGSSDCTAAIVEALAARDDRIRLLRHDRNLGISSARNTAIAASRGEYLAFLDADDLWDRDKIVRQLEKLSTQPDTGLIFTASRVIDAQGHTQIDNLSRRKKIPVGRVTPRQFIIDRYPLVTSSVLLRREALDKVGPFNTDYSTLEDFDLWLRILQRYPQAYVPEVLTSYRRHSHNTVANELRNRENKIHYIEALLADDNPLTTELEKPLSHFLHRQYLRLARLHSARGNRAQAQEAYDNALRWRVSLPRHLKTRLLKFHYLAGKRR